MNIIFDKEIPEYGDLMTKKDWLEAVKDGWFIDYDGHGELSNGVMCSSQFIRPSKAYVIKDIPEVTHIVWYNR